MIDPDRERLKSACADALEALRAHQGVQLHRTQSVDGLAGVAATQIAKPFHRPGWVYEEKVDGWRVLAYKDAAGVRLVSRNGKDLTRRFPELAAAVAALKPPTLLLDGEIAVFDSQLISHFEWIRAQPKDEPATPPTLIAFDCLYTRGRISGSDGSGCDGTCSRSLSMISS